MVHTRMKILKTALISLLVASLLLSLVTFKCFSACEPGDCSDNPIMINSVQDLEALEEDIEEGNSYSGKFVVLNRDITIDKHSKKLIKNFNDNGFLFNGTFDGNFDSNGHTIEIEIKNDVKNSEKSLFKSLGSKASIKN